MRGYVYVYVLEGHRLLLNRVVTDSAKASNSKCAVAAEVTTGDEPASVVVEYTNGAKETFGPEAGSVDDVLYAIRGTQQRIDNAA